MYVKGYFVNRIYIVRICGPLPRRQQYIEHVLFLICEGSLCSNTRGVQFNLLHFYCAVKTAQCVEPIKSLLQ